MALRPLCAVVGRALLECHVGAVGGTGTRWSHGLRETFFIIIIHPFVCRRRAFARGRSPRLFDAVDPLAFNDLATRMLAHSSFFY